MFKVDFFVHDPKLGRALRALKGLAVGTPTVVLVSGHPNDPDVDDDEAESQVSKPGSGNRLGNPKPIGTRILDKTAAWLIEKAPPFIDSKVIRKAVVAAGGTVGSYTYIIRELRKGGILSGPGDLGRYTVDAEAFNKLMEKAK